jgi:Uma2 family endonuclease
VIVAESRERPVTEALVRELWLVDAETKQIEVRENLNANTKWDRIVVYEEGDFLESKVNDGLRFCIDEIVGK